MSEANEGGILSDIIKKFCLLCKQRKQTKKKDFSDLLKISEGFNSSSIEGRPKVIRTFPMIYLKIL